MAFLGKTTKRGTQRWRVVWTDATRGAGKVARREAWCDATGHTDALDAARYSADERAALAAGATNAVLRTKLLRAYEALELARLRDAARSKAVGVTPAFGTNAHGFFDACERYVRHRVGLSTGEQVPLGEDPGWRAGSVGRPLRPRSASEILRTIGRFRARLAPSLTTGEMTGEHLRAYLMAERQAGRSVRYINNQRSYLSSLFGALAGRARKTLFRSDPLQWFVDEVEALPVPKADIEVYDAATVVAFMEAAERHADPDREITVHRRKRGGKLETYTQRIAVDPAPVLQWALLFACTGVRRGEAENLRWSDVDLEHGVIRIRASKTGSVRHLPLIGDPAGDVAPGLFDVLKAWRARRPNDTHVMPSTNGSPPMFPAHAWQSVANAANVDVKPQGLRRTFESMLAMIGIPAGLSAFWLGHSVQIAERHYRAYRPGRQPGATVDAAIGLTPTLAREVDCAPVLRAVPKHA